MTVVDNAIYVGGRRAAEPAGLDETYEIQHDRGGMAWIGMYRPDAAEVRSVASEFSLHPLAEQDTIRAHQRPKLERYGNVLFTVLRPARNVPEQHAVEFGEVHVFTGPDFVITVRHAESPDLGQVRRRMEGNPALLDQGPEAVLYAVLDEVVDEYQPVAESIEYEIDVIEDQLFHTDADVSRRMYQLSEDVIGLQRATHPLIPMLEDLSRGFAKYQVHAELQDYLRDVLDHVHRIVERVDSFRALLQNALSVHATLVAQRQNQEMRNLTEASLEQNREMRRLTEASFAQNEQIKRISAWAAILFAPTLVGTVYGMNFESMPELDWAFGYPMALGLMLLTALVLYLVFKALKWL